VGADFVPNVDTPGDVPDVLARDLTCVFCGINPGRVSAAAGAHFANPRNDFWRLLHDAGFTPRLYAPEEQFALLELGYGVTNAAFRTTRGSGDLRSADFSDAADRLTRIARELRPRAIAFVGKEAYRGTFGVRPELGRQERVLVDTGLFVLPSTSPANAVVPYAERLHWFRKLQRWVDTDAVERHAVRALVLDASGRTLLLRWMRPEGSTFWTSPGGGVEAGETELEALRRELGEELGLLDAEIGQAVWTREFVFPWGDRWLAQRERYFLVRAEADTVDVPDLTGENVHEHRWWTVDEIEASEDIVVPSRLAELLRDLERNGPPRQPLDVGI
jgi:double-stranded uracil-DNA glycosylase